MKDFYKLSIDELKNRREVLLRKREAKKYILADLEELEAIDIAIHYKEVELPILDKNGSSEDNDEEDIGQYSIENIKRRLQEERKNRRKVFTQYFIRN